MAQTRTEGPLPGTLDGQARRDRSFVAMLVLLLALMVWVVMDGTDRRGRSQPGAHGAIRPVAAEVLREQLDSGRLSRHRAAHWRTWPQGAPAPEGAAQ